MRIFMYFRQENFVHPEFAAMNSVVDELANKVPLQWSQFMELDEEEAMPKVEEALEEHLIGMSEFYKEATGFALEGLILPSERRLAQALGMPTRSWSYAEAAKL